MELLSNDDDSVSADLMMENISEDDNDDEAAFRSLLIPETEMLVSTKTRLEDTIAQLTRLRDTILDGLRDGESHLGLVDRIGREISLYQEFTRNLDVAFVPEDLDVLDEMERKLGASIMHQAKLSLGFEAKIGFGRDPSLSHIEAPLRHYRGPLDTHSVSSSVILARQDTIAADPLEPLKWTSLTTLSNPVFSSAYEREMGAPTLLRVKSGFILGTSKSLFLIFDLTQTLTTILGNVSKSVLYGASTAVSVSDNFKTLVGGHARGYIVLYDLVRRRPIKVIPPVSLNDLLSGKVDGHLSGPITHLSFSSKLDLVSADLSGCSFYHQVNVSVVGTSVDKTRIHGRPTKPDLSHQSNQKPTSTIYALSCLASVKEMTPLVALATPFKLAIVALKPSPMMLFRMNWKSVLGNDANSSPRTASVAWNFSGEDQDPCLLFTCDSLVGILSISYDQKDSDKKMIKFTVKKTRHLDQIIVYAQWINSTMIILLTIKMEILFLDALDLSVLEKSSLGSQSVRGLGIFSSVQPNACPFYSHSLSVYRSRLFVFGSNGISCAALSQWKDRLGRLVSVGQFQIAFQMAVDLYQGRPKCAVLGLPPFPQGQLELREHVSVLVQSYLAMSLSSIDGNVDSEIKSFDQISNCIVNTCLGVELTSLLFTEIYERFVDASLEYVFLETLEPLFLNETLQGHQDPVIIQSLIRHYVFRGWLDRLQQILLHLDPRGLDIHQIIQICKQYRLYAAMFHVYNVAVEDYVTPLLDVLKVMDHELSGSVTDSSGHGDALFHLYVYLAYILARKSFPLGLEMEEDQVRSTCDVYSLLFSPQFLPVSMDPSSDKWTSAKEPYPYLGLLLAHAPTLFLNGLSEAFEDRVWKVSIPINGNIFQTNETRRKQLMTRQFIVSVLVSVWTSALEDPSKSFVVSLGCFIGKHYGRYRAHIILEPDVLDHLFWHLASIKDDDTLNDRQTALISILSAGHVPLEGKEKWAGDLGTLYETHGLWRVYQYHVEHLKQYDLVLKAYLSDPSRRAQVFDALESLLRDSQLTFTHVMSLKKSVMENIGVLVELSELRAANLVSTYWPLERVPLIARLESVPRLQMKLLRGFLEPPISSMMFKGVTENPIGRARYPSESSLVSFGSDMYDLYVSRLAEFEPTKVLHFFHYLLDSLERFPFHIANAVDVCRKRGVYDAGIWLLEHIGSIDEALDMLLECLPAAYESDCSRQFPKAAKSLDLVHSAIGLCEKSNVALSDQDAETMWLRLLDKVYFELPASGGKPSPTRKPSTKRQVHEPLARLVLTSVSSHLSLPLIISRIVEKQKQARIGEHRGLIGSMLDSCSYQLETFTSAHAILAEDGFKDLYSLATALKTGYRPMYGQCQVCKKLLHIRAMSFQQKDEDVVLFRCFHAYHKTCLHQSVQEVIEGTLGDYPVWCTTCQPKPLEKDLRRARKGKEKRQVTSLPDVRLGVTQKTLEEWIDTANRVIYDLPAQLLEQSRHLAMMPTPTMETDDDIIQM